MSKFKSFSVKARNFKCFGAEEQGFDQIKSVNIILGRNNSGKSTLLDFLEELSRLEKIQKEFRTSSEPKNWSTLKAPAEYWHGKSEPEFIIEICLTESSLRDNFSGQTRFNSDVVKILSPEEQSRNPYSSITYRDIVDSYINAQVQLKIELTPGTGAFSKIMFKKTILNIKPVYTSEKIREKDYFSRMAKILEDELSPSNRRRRTLEPQPNYHAIKTEYEKLHGALLRSVEKDLDQCLNQFMKKQFRRIHPDRNIVPEADDISDLKVFGDGKGITNIIQNFYNQEILDRDAVERTILHDLNKIFKSDAEFLRILPRRKSDGKWEIALEEEEKGLILLSQSGSSLKTVMILLVHLYLLPIVEKHEISEYVLSIEELENNLHPALLRRLLFYLSDKAKNDGCTFFISTHSSVAIDVFSHDQDAQLIHVTHDSKTSCARAINTHTEGMAVLDDLGVRASDLLQANGIVWVEGPSDVVFIEKWLELYCREIGQPVPRRGLDYEFQMFAGTLLDSLCLIKSGMSEEEEYRKLVSMLSFSRNAFVVIDSDAIEKNKKIVDKSKFAKAKKFIRAQFEELNEKGLKLGLWYKAGCTKIRTLEDYIDEASIKEHKTQDKSKKSKKIYAQVVTRSWDETKQLKDFPNNLKKEVESLYELIMEWNS